MPRSARSVPTPVGLVVVSVLFAVATAWLATGSGAGAQDPAATTIRFTERDSASKFTHIRNTKTRSRSANSAGDVVAFTTPLFDSAGTRIGKLHWAGATTVGARDFMNSTVTCHGVIALQDGTLTIEFILSPRDRTTTGAVTGGTGAYANARGVVVSEGTDQGADDVVTLVASSR